MAVEELKSGKVLIKGQRSISEAVLIENDNNLYGEQYPKQDLNVNQLANLLAEKINIDTVKSAKTQAIDIDIKREILINKVDKNAVKSELIEGKVNNKLDKLKALRRNGTTNN